MTTTQIQSKVKSQIKSQYVKKNEVIDWSINGDDSFGVVKVTMPSTCDMNGTMTWGFTYSYEPSNIDVFTEIQRLQFPEMITKEKLIIKEI